MNLIKCVSFDFDRTLAHVTPTTYDLIPKLLSQKGISVTSQEIREGRLKVLQNLPENLKLKRDLFGTLSKGERIQFIKEFNKLRVDMLDLQKPQEDIEKLKHWLAEQIFINQKKILYDDVVEVIKRLAEKKLKLYILSGNHSDGIIELLGQNDIKDLFEEIITVDKYHPKKIDNFRILLNHSRLQPSEILHIGDEIKTDGIGASKYNLNVLIIQRDVNLVDSGSTECQFSIISELSEIFSYI